MRKSLIILSALLLTGIGASAMGVDYTSQMNTSTSTAPQGGLNAAMSWGAEAYVGDGFSSGKVLYQTTGTLSAGTYEVSFFAFTRIARDLNLSTYGGENKAQAYATAGSSTVTKAMTISTDAYIPDMYGWTTDDIVTLTVMLASEGTIEYGLQNIDTGGQWYGILPISLIRTDETATINVGAKLHECEDELGDWALTTTPTKGHFWVNTWSTEPGLTTPYLEYWVGGNVAPIEDNTIYHRQLTDLPAGMYTVSIDARAFNEAGTAAITSNTIFFFAEGKERVSVDLTTGTGDTYNGEAEVYGTYTVVAEVGEAGTLDIGFTVSSTNSDWLSFKNLVVEYDGESLPDLTYVTGTMNADVETAMKAAVDAYNESKSADLYSAALAAIAAAEESVAQYAEIAALVEALDTDGATVWAITASGIAYTAKTLTTSDDISEDMAAAQKAQTTDGSDLTYVVTTGSWSAPYDNDEVAGTSAMGYTESYSSSAYTADEGQILYKTITGLQPGTYTVTFYAAANVAWIDASSGASIAQAFAIGNCSATTDDMTVGTATTYTFTDSDKYTLTCTVGMNGKLTFGIQNIGSGGNWYVAEAVSLTLVELADITTVRENIFLKNVYGGDLVSRGKQLGVAADVDFVGTPLTLYSYDGGETVVIWYADADIINADVEYQSYLGGTNWASANNTLCDAVSFTMTETNYTDSEGNTGYQFSSEAGLLYRYDAASTPEQSPASENTYRLAVNGTKDTNYSDDNQAIWVIVEATERDAIKAAWVAEQKVAVATAAGLSDITTEAAFDEYVATLAETAIVENEISTAEVGEWSGVTSFNTDGYGVEAYQGYVRLTRDFTGLDQGIYKITLNGLDRNSDPAYSTDMYEKGYTDLSESYIYANGYEINLQPWASEGYWNASTGYYYPNWMNESSAMFDAGSYLNTLYTYVGEDGDLSIQIAMLVTEYYGWAQVKNFSLYRLDEQIEWTLGAEYGTLILPFDYDLSADDNTSGLTAYTVESITDDGDDATLNLSEGTTSIEANTPYIIGGTTGEYSFIGIPTNDADSYTSDDGYLTGVLETTTAPNNGSTYVLQNQDSSGLAFYLVASDDITVGAYHCYLNYPATTGAKLVVNFPDNDIATRIDAVETEETANEAIYDLSGRRVAKAQKGVYIVNGKKMVIK